MEQMEQIQVSENIRQGAKEAIDSLNLAMVKDVMLSVIQTSDDPHLLAQIHTTATVAAETEEELRKNRVKRRAFHPIHNPEGTIRGTATGDTREGQTHGKNKVTEGADQGCPGIGATHHATGCYAVVWMQPTRRQDRRTTE